MQLNRHIVDPENFLEIKEFYKQHGDGGMDQVDDATLKKLVDNKEILILRVDQNIVAAIRFTYNFNVPLGIVKSMGLEMDQYQCLSSFSEGGVDENFLKSTGANNTLVSYAGSLVVHRSHRGNKIMEEILNYYTDAIKRDFFGLIDKEKLMFVFGLHHNKHLPILWMSYISNIHDKMQIGLEINLPMWECYGFSIPGRTMFFLVGTFTKQITSRL